MMFAETAQTKKSKGTLPNIACIDGTYLGLLIPVREYLSENHVAISFNNPEPAHCLYHVFIGTPQDVRDFFCRNKRSAVHRLIFLLNGDTDDAERFATEYSAKVALIDDHPLTPHLARVAFGFLFASEGAVLTLKDNQIVSSQITKQDEQPKEESRQGSWEADRQRIKTMSKQYFKKPPVSGKQELKRFFRLLIVYALLSYCTLLGSHAFSLIAGSYFLLSSFNQISSNKPNNSVRLSSAFLVYARDTLPLVTWSAFYQPLEKSVRDYERLVIDAQLISRTGLSLEKILEGALSMNLFLNGKKGGESPTVFLTSAAAEWQKEKAVISRVVADMETAMDQPVFPFSLPFILKRLDHANTLLARIQRQGDVVARIATLYPHIAGTGEEKNYLVLLQNSMELRPTGGFIGSVGLLTFRGGSIADFVIQDVYQIDGQLRGHVDPPLPFKNILSAEHWYLRDSNWDPDFRKAAQKAEWFLKTSTGKTVDGVMAINLPVVQDLLAATGPITLPDEKITVSADTLFGLLDKEIHTNFFPGSTQKQDLLGELSRRLITKISDGKDVHSLSLVDAIAGGLLGRNILLYSSDGESQKIIEEYEWGGAFLTKSPCGGINNCLPDMFATIEANLAVNKVNYYVKRSAKRHLTINENEIAGEDVFTFTNTSQGDAMMGGNYTNYERFYYPDTVQIHHLTLNGQEVNVQEGTSSAALPYAEKTQEREGIQTIGVGFSVHAKEETNLVIEFSRPVGKTPEVYALSIQKQGGVEEYPLMITLDLPETYVPQASARPLPLDSKAFVAKRGRFEYNTHITQDQTVIVEFKKNNE